MTRFQTAYRIQAASIACSWPKPTEPAWAASLAEHWTPGEAGARERLAQLDLANYAEERDIPALNATSLLSPHLRFGEHFIPEIPA